jgi:hypothetical protein
LAAPRAGTRRWNSSVDNSEDIGAIVKLTGASSRGSTLRGAAALRTRPSKSRIIFSELFFKSFC